MATLLPRRNREGQLIGWQAQIRKKGYPLKVQTFDRKADAQAWATVVESEMARKIHVDRSKSERTTFREAIEDYIERVAPTHKGARDEVLRLRKFLRDEPKLAAHSLATLTTRSFEDYRDRRLQAVTPSTLKRELGLLHTVVESVRKSHGMIENPISDVKRPTVHDARDVRLHGDEAGILLEACEGARNKWLFPTVILAIETAMRRSELLSLKWSHVNLEQRTAFLPDTKPGNSRTVPLSSLAVAVLQSLDSTRSGVVIGTSAEGIKQSFERARKRANMEHLNFHDLRHEATTRLFERGWNVMEVAAVTGHKDLKMLKRYTNLRATDLAKRLG